MMRIKLIGGAVTVAACVAAVALWVSGDIPGGGNAPPTSIALQPYYPDYRSVDDGAEARRLAGVRARGQLAMVGPPGWNVERAYKDFRGDNRRKQDRDAAYLDLQVFIVVRNAAEIALNRDYVEREGWDAGFLQLFDQTIAWGEALKKMPPDEVYEMAKRLGVQGGERYENPLLWDEANRSPESRLGFHIYLLSRSLESPIGNYETALVKLSRGDSLGGRIYLNDSAERNYVPAVLHLIGVYKSRGDYGKAYYWVRRAKAAGISVTEDDAELARLTPAKELKQIQGWLRDGESLSPP